MLVGTVSVFASCGKEDPCKNGHVNENADGKCDICEEVIQHRHKDDDGDKKCDVCSKDMSDGNVDGGGGDEIIEYPWIDDDPVKLIFQMTEHTNGRQNPSGCHRYLAGDDPDAKETIDTNIANRNADAEFYTNVMVSYLYYLDVPEYEWGKCIEIIYNNSMSNSTKDLPDMYCNFTYDMVGTSLKGSLANLKSTKLNYDGANYFEFLDEDYDETKDNKGYMYEYMESTTLSQHKMYVLASDYFIDLVRAFFVVPVNISLLNSVVEDVTGDKNGDGDYTIEDFYLEVEEQKWTYNKVAQYSAAVYKPGAGNDSDENIDDTLGMALSFSGPCSSGIVYSTNVTVIEKVMNTDKGDYDYSYPTDGSALYELFDAVANLLTQKGVFALHKDHNQAKKYGTSAALTIRARFCENKILFGDIVCLGALEEEDTYQKLNASKDSGFGVVPVPLYKEAAEGSTNNYLTSIHNNARPGGIAKTTKHFAECTAFLNYQSTHSPEILEDYYDDLMVRFANGSEGTIRMLQYIRLNVRSAFDKTFEDAIGVYESELFKQEWHQLIINDDKPDSVSGVDIRTAYKQTRDNKHKVLETLYKLFPELP